MQLRERSEVRKKTVSNKYAFLGAFITFSTLSIIIQISQISNKGFILGVDSIFHMNRIYDAMMQLKTGEYSYFISIFGYDQSARIVNAVYGPFMAYLLGGVLLITGSWVKFQLVTSFFINVIGAMGIFRLAKKIQLSNIISIACGTLYMSTYFLASWNYNGSFTAIGAMVIPWVLYYGIEMVMDNERNFSVLGLGIAMGIMLQTHVFSSLLATLALIPFVGYSFVTCKKKTKFVLNMVGSILIAILISLNVFLGLIHLFMNNNVVQTVPADLFAHTLNFSSFLNDSQSNVGMIFSIIYLVQIFILIFSWKKLNTLIKILTITGGFFLLLASQWFPWQIISDLFPSLQSSVQFPSRLQVIPATFLILSFALIIEKWKSQFGLALLCAATLMSLSLAQNRISDRMIEWNSNNVLAAPNKIPNDLSANEMRGILKSKKPEQTLSKIHKGTPDYLPIKDSIETDKYESSNLYGKYWDSFIYPNNHFLKKVEHGKLIVEWNSETDEKTEIPIAKYANTVIKKDGKEISPETNFLGAIIVDSMPGKNSVEVSYQAPRYVTLSIIVAAASLIIFLIIRTVQVLFRRY